MSAAANSEEVGLVHSGQLLGQDAVITDAPLEDDGNKPSSLPGTTAKLDNNGSEETAASTLKALEPVAHKATDVELDLMLFVCSLNGSFDRIHQIALLAVKSVMKDLYPDHAKFEFESVMALDRTDVFNSLVAVSGMANSPVDSTNSTASASATTTTTTADSANKDGTEDTPVASPDDPELAKKKEQTRALLEDSVNALNAFVKEGSSKEAETFQDTRNKVISTKEFVEYYEKIIIPGIGNLNDVKLWRFFFEAYSEVLDGCHSVHRNLVDLPRGSLAFQLNNEHTFKKEELIKKAKLVERKKKQARKAPEVGEASAATATAPVDGKDSGDIEDKDAILKLNQQLIAEDEKHAKEMSEVADEAKKQAEKRNYRAFCLTWEWLTTRKGTREARQRTLTPDQVIEYLTEPELFDKLTLPPVAFFVKMLGIYFVAAVGIFSICKDVEVHFQEAIIVLEKVEKRKEEDIDQSIENFIRLAYDESSFITTAIRDYLAAARAIELIIDILIPVALCRERRLWPIIDKKLADTKPLPNGELDYQRAFNEAVDKKLIAPSSYDPLIRTVYEGVENLDRIRNITQRLVVAGSNAWTRTCPPIGQMVATLNKNDFLTRTFFSGNEEFMRSVHQHAMKVVDMTVPLIRKLNERNAERAKKKQEEQQAAEREQPQASQQDSKPQ